MKFTKAGPSPSGVTVASLDVGTPFVFIAGKRLYIRSHDAGDGDLIHYLNPITGVSDVIESGARVIPMTITSIEAEPKS